MFKNSVRTAKKTPNFTITKIKWLTLIEEKITVYTELSYETHKYKMKSYWLLKEMGLNGI
jgi:hypothetical protein